MRRKPAASLVLVALAAALALACDLPPSFGPEYQDSTANFISVLPLAVPPPASDHGVAVPPDIALDALATWDWAWRGKVGTTNTYDYMTLDSSSAPALAAGAGIGAGPGGTDAWLMVTENLAANSTFNAAPVGMSGAGLTITNGGAYPGHGASLLVSGFDDGEYLALSSGLFTDGPGPGEPHAYLLSLNTDVPSLTYLRHYSDDTASFVYADKKANFQLPGWTADGINTIPFTDVGSAAGWSLLFIRSSGSLLMDDLTAIRIDKDFKNWALELRLSAADTMPVLVPGTYEFSVYVGKPAGYLYSTEARDAEPYASRFVTLRMVQTVLGITQTVAEETFDLTLLPAGWNRLVLRMDPGSNFTFRETDAGQLIKLSISGLHARSDRLEPGAVLLAAPSLNFYINGY